MFTENLHLEAIMNKKAIIMLASAAIAASAVILHDSAKSPVPESDYVSASTVSERVTYFALHGWDVEEICSKTVAIPDDFSAAYEEYALLQDKQGMPLREYAGEDAQLYVYEVKNYSPDSRKMLAELLVCDDTAVASMIYSEDGGSLRLAVN